MTPRELAKKANITPNMVYSYIRSGRLQKMGVTVDRLTLEIGDEEGKAWAEEMNKRREERNKKKELRIERELKGH